MSETAHWPPRLLGDIKPASAANDTIVISVMAAIRPYIERLFAALVLNEWILDTTDGFMRCPECSYKQADGHDQFCDTGNALDEWRPTP